MKFPFDILDMRDVKKYEPLEVKACKEVHIRLVMDTIVSRTNLDRLKTALIHHDLVPSYIYEFTNHYHLRGSIESYGEYTITLSKTHTHEELTLEARIKDDQLDEGRIIFKAIKTYLDLSNPLAGLSN